MNVVILKDDNDEKVIRLQNVRRISFDKKFPKRKMYYEDFYDMRGKGRFVDTSNAICIDVEIE